MNKEGKTGIALIAVLIAIGILAIGSIQGLTGFATAKAGTCVIGPNTNAPAKVSLGQGVVEHAGSVCDVTQEGGCGACLELCSLFRNVKDLYGCPPCGGDGWCNPDCAVGEDPDCWWEGVIFEDDFESGTLDKWTVESTSYPCGGHEVADVDSDGDLEARLGRTLGSCSSNWGYHSLYKDFLRSEVGLDLKVKASFALHNPNMVYFTVSFLDGSGAGLGGIMHYMRTNYMYSNTDKSYCVDHGDTLDTWQYVDIDVKRILDEHLPGVDQSAIHTIRISMILYQDGGYYSDGWFDDIEVRLAKA